MTDIFSNMVSMARRFKTATAMNLIGMTMAYAICYLLLTQIDYQRQYNHCIKDYERTYVLETSLLQNEGEWTSGLPGICWSAGEILSEMPEVEDIGVIDVEVCGEHGVEQQCSRGPEQIAQPFFACFNFI